MTVDEQHMMTMVEQIHAMLRGLAERPQAREWYTTEQFAHLIGRAEFTVREMCRHGRLNARKMLSGRGGSFQWSISHDEFVRYQKEGLLPRQN
jgi:hypothetical protein